MSNSFFQFQKFIIRQDRCAMKVGTDSIILGCLTNPENASHILDVGTGTGLLALMMAHKTKASIDAIEIVTEAAEQAKQNVRENHMDSRIRVINGDFRDFTSGKKYDLIISNPPYYSSGPDSIERCRRISRYTSELSHTDFFRKAAEILSPGGSIAVCLPYNIENKVFSIIENNNMYVNLVVNVKNSVRNDFYLSVIFSSFIQRSPHPETRELTIRESNGEYTEVYRKLTSDLFLSPEQKIELKLKKTFSRPVTPEEKI